MTQAQNGRGTHSADQRTVDQVGDVDVPASAVGVGWQPSEQRPVPTAPAPRRLPRRRPWRDREGHYELRPRGHRSTTRQGEVLNLALAARPASHRRLYLGRDKVTGQAYYFDQFDAYHLDAGSTDISIALIGDLGAGKSGLNKCHFVMRMLLIPDRYVVVLDKKLQGTEGEYAPLARRLGTEPVFFLVGGCGSRINLLDRSIGLYLDQPDTDEAGSGDPRPTGQMKLIRAVLREAMERGLSEFEGKAVRVALVAAHARAARQHRVAIVADLVWCLFNPVDHYAVDPAAAYDAETVWNFDADAKQDEPAPQVTAKQLRKWGKAPALALERLIEDDLVGLVDGETSPEVRADHPCGLTVFDISKLPSDGPALPIVMLLIQTWLSNVLATRAARQQQTVCIVEEAWHVAVRGDIGEIFKQNIKVSRGSGMSTVSGFHRPSDLPRDTPARALIQDVRTLFLFQQGRDDDIDETMRMAQLDPSMRANLTQLAQGECIVVRKGVDPVTIKIERSSLEVLMSNTDDQIIGRPELQP